MANPHRWKPRTVMANDAAHLADLGAQMYAPGQFTLDVSRDCSSPRYVEVSYTDQHRSKWRTWRGNVEYSVACRQCKKCLERRRRHWQARIVKELRQADRSWFGTLTIEPENAFLASLRAQKEAARRGVLWTDITEKERFNATVNALSVDISLFLKRVRKNSGAHVRYCLVAESHKSGVPHFHAVIHHRVVPVRHKTLKDAWRLGFSDFKLVDENTKVARYIAKYLAKALGSRVRASARYGDNDLSHSVKTREEKHASIKFKEEIQGTPDLSVYREGAMCLSCGTALENLYGHYDKAYREGVPASERKQDERLSNEAAVYSAEGCSAPREHPKPSDLSKSETPGWPRQEEAVATGEAASKTGARDAQAAIQADCAASTEGAETEPVSAGRYWPEIWACPKGCLRDAPLSLWLTVGPASEGATAPSDVRSAVSYGGHAT